MQWQPHDTLPRNMAVSTSGAVLSSLLYEHSNSQGDQEGFLLGQVVSHVTDTISDSQLNNRKEETVSYIYNYIACNGPFSWYDNAGRIVVDKLKALLKNKHKEVIGWYKWRRQSSMSPSLREQAIHKALVENFPGVAADRFLFSIFSTSCTSNLATHSIDHVFQCYNGSSFVNLPLTIVNLRDTCVSDYKLQQNSTSNLHTGLYGETLQTFRPEFEDPATGRLHQVQGIQSLNSKLHHQLVDLQHLVSKSEEAVGSLSAEVQNLRERWKAKRYPPSQPQKVSLVAVPKVDNQQQRIKYAVADPDLPKPVPKVSRQPSNQEQITEELKDLFAAPPLETKPCFQPPGACGYDASITANSQSLLKESRAVSPALSHDSTCTTSSEDMEVTESKKPHTRSPRLSRKDVQVTKAEKVYKLNKAPSTLSSTEELPTTTKRGDAFSFVDDLIQKAQSPPTAKANLSFFPTDTKANQRGQKPRAQSMILEDCSVDQGAKGEGSRRSVTPPRVSSRSLRSQLKIAAGGTGQVNNTAKSKTAGGTKRSMRQASDVDMNSSRDTDNDIRASPTF